MATLASLRTDVRSRIVEPSADFFADSELNTWLNQGYKNFAAETLWFEKIFGFSPTAGTEEYTLPSDNIFINQVMWDDRWPVHDQDLEEFRRYVSTANFTQSTRPFVYTLFPWDGRIRLYPIPSAAISTTLNGGINSSVNSIVLTDASLFPSRGRILIGTEQIYYTGKSSNTLTGCGRGDSFTTAASHSNGDACSVARCWLYMSYMPPDMTASIDSRTGPLFDEALISYAVSIALTKRDRYSQASYYNKVYQGLVAKAKEMKAQRDRDRGWAIKDDYPEWLM